MKRTTLLLLASATVMAALTAAPAVPAASGRRTLIGTVGPGFTITLKTANGKRVQRLQSGTYTVKVHDLSPIHDFHLFGPGVNKRTLVARTGSTVWVVKLRRGTYRFLCDPHKSIMHGSFKVS